MVQCLNKSVDIHTRFFPLLALPFALARERKRTRERARTIQLQPIFPILPRFFHYLILLALAFSAIPFIFSSLWCIRSRTLICHYSPSTGTARIVEPTQTSRQQLISISSVFENDDDYYPVGNLSSSLFSIIPWCMRARVR